MSLPRKPRCFHVPSLQFSPRLIRFRLIKQESHLYWSLWQPFCFRGLLCAPSHAINIDDNVRIGKGWFLGFQRLRVYADFHAGLPTCLETFANRLTSAREINQRPARFWPSIRPERQYPATVCRSSPSSGAASVAVSLLSMSLL